MPEEEEADFLDGETEVDFLDGDFFSGEVAGEAS